MLHFIPPILASANITLNKESRPDQCLIDAIKHMHSKRNTVILSNFNRAALNERYLCCRRPLHRPPFFSFWFEDKRCKLKITRVLHKQKKKQKQKNPRAVCMCYPCRLTTV